MLSPKSLRPEDDPTTLTFSAGMATPSVVRRDLGVDILEMRGAGAVGGMGGGAVAFLGGKLQMGIETILDVVRFE